MYKIKGLENKKEVCDILDCLILSDSTIDRIRNVFISEMELALNMQPSSLQMENTYIPELLDGTESGTYLAMDLGGTNLRVMFLELAQGKVIDEGFKHFPIADDLRIGCGERLFNYLAQCVHSFILEMKLHQDKKYPLGFTFSFPMRQNGLDSGILVTWTKSFNIPSVVGQDAVLMLRKGLQQNQCDNVEVIAILNDTTGTLMHGALLDSSTRIGIVLGTGSNGCYMEKASRVKHWEQQRHGEDHVIIDVEWGAFGDNGVLDFIKTDFDKIVDNSSLLKKSFTFEKYISGKYLGELCRVILMHLYEKKFFLNNLPSRNFPKAWSFGSDNISKIEHDTLRNSQEHLKLILKEHFNASEYTQDDLDIVQYVCGLISHRAAQLVAINTAVLLNRMDDETDITVAIDGSVYVHHPRIKYWLDAYTKQWAPTKNCKFMIAQDGSGKGAALAAAIADKLRNREHSN